MHKTLTTAALIAAIFSAGSAMAAPAAVTVSLTGKSHQQIHSELKLASRTVCDGSAPGSLLAVEIERACAKRTYERAVSALPALQQARASGGATLAAR